MTRPRIMSRMIVVLMLAVSATACSFNSANKLGPSSGIPTGTEFEYPAKDYLTGSGEGVSQNLADKTAIQKVIQQIQVSITSRLLDVQRSSKRNGRLETENDVSLAVETKVDIDRLTGLAIARRYVDKKGEFHSFAVLDREKASISLGREIRESYDLATKYLELAEDYKRKKELAGAIRNYAKAEAVLEKIKPQERLVFGITGSEVKNDASAAKIKMKLIEAMSNVKVSVNLSVTNAGKHLKSELYVSFIAERLINLGWQVVPSGYLPDTDALIRVRVRMDSRKKGESGRIVYAYSDASINVIDGKTNIVIKTINIKPASFKSDTGYDTKGAGPTLETAGMNSLRKTIEIIRREVAKSFTEYFTGEGGE